MRSGIAMSEAHSLRITLLGPGRARRHALGHGRRDRRGRPTWWAAWARWPRGCATRTSDCVCSAGTLQAGTAVNVVPTSARVTGTLRTFTDAQTERRSSACGRCAPRSRESHEVTIDLELPERTPAVVNDAEP